VKEDFSLLFSCLLGIFIFAWAEKRKVKEEIKCRKERVSQGTRSQVSNPGIKPGSQTNKKKGFSIFGIILGF